MYSGTITVSCPDTMPSSLGMPSGLSGMLKDVQRHLEIQKQVEKSAASLQRLATPHKSLIESLTRPALRLQMLETSSMRLSTGSGPLA